MSEALVTRGESSKIQAAERLSNKFQEVIARSNLIKAVLPSLSVLQILPGQRRSANLIRVTLNKSTFSPGDVVQGTIKLMLSKTIHAQRLVVLLGGESKTTSVRVAPTHGGGHIIYDSFFKLVDTSTDVELEQKVLVPRIYEFPFNITLPLTATRREEDWPYDENTFRFNNGLTQPLPGSFKGSSTETAQAHCKIRYYVIAKLVSKEAKATLQHKIPLNIAITHTRALTAGDGFDTCFMKCSFSLKLSQNSQMAAMPQTKEAPLSPSSRFRDKIQHKVSSLMAPSYSFDLDARIPRFGRISQPLSIVLKLSKFQQSSRSARQADAPAPSVSLKAVSVELQSLYMFRGITKDPINDMSWQLVDKPLSYHVIWKSAKIVISELKDSIPSLEPDKEIDLGKLMFVHPRSIPPAFKTWNISRDYLLMVLCDLECAGKSFQAKYRVDKFDVLPGDGIEDDFFEARPTYQAEVESESESQSESDGEDDDGKQVLDVEAAIADETVST